MYLFYVVKDMLPVIEKIQLSMDLRSELENTVDEGNYARVSLNPLTYPDVFQIESPKGFGRGCNARTSLSGPSAIKPPDSS